MTDDLIKRLDGAENGGRDLDVHIGIAAGIGGRIGSDFAFSEGEHWRKGLGKRLEDAVNDWPKSISNIAIFWHVPQYSTSLDAIISLVESDGGFLWEIGTAECEATITWETQPSYWNERAVGESYQADGTTFNPALAMCIAFFKALKERKAVP